MRSEGRLWKESSIPGTFLRCNHYDLVIRGRGGTSEVSGSGTVWDCLLDKEEELLKSRVLETEFLKCIGTRCFLSVYK